MEKETICEMCGDRGWENAFVFCVKCLNFAIHRYCLPIIPETFDEFVRWWCEDCEEIYGKPYPFNAPFSVPSAKRNLRASEEEPYKEAKKRKLRKPTNDSSEIELNMKVTKEKDNASSVKKTDAKKHDKGPLQPCGTPTKLANADNKVDNSSPPRRRSKKLRKSWTMKKRRRSTPVVVSKPEKPKGKISLSGELCKENKEHLVSDGAGLCEAAVDVARIAPDVEIVHMKKKSENVVPEGVRLCEGSADVASVASDSQIVCDDSSEVLGKTLVSYGGKLCEATSHVPRIEHDSQSVSVDSCNAIEDICQIPAQPVINPVWSGKFDIKADEYGLYDGLVAHMSSKACPMAYEEAELFPRSISMELLPKGSVWPKRFQESKPSDDNIAVYFFASNKSYERIFDDLVSEMMSKELALRAIVTNAELLVFTSNELPVEYQYFARKLYLWGVFRNKQAPTLNAANHHLLSQEVEKGGNRNLASKKTLDAMSPRSPLISSSKWTLPVVGEFKMNVSASVDADTGKGAVGGLIRDSNGQWVHGFFMYLGIFSLQTAHLCAIFKGLEIAWRIDIHKMTVESDSKEAVEAVVTALPDHPHYNYIENIKKSMDTSGCRIKCVTRDANTCADRLTQEAFRALTVKEMAEAPEFMSTFLASDLEG